MTIKIFPDVPVDIKPPLSHENPFYLCTLNVPLYGISEVLALALAAGIETTKSFLGATIDVYVQGARHANPGLRHTPDTDFLSTLIN